MKNKLLWAAAGLPCLTLAGLIAIDHAGARQVPPDDAVLELPKAASDPALPPLETQALPLPGELPDDGPLPLGAEDLVPDPVAIPATESVPVPAEPADPLRRVAALSEQIRSRRGEDLAAVQAMVEHLAREAQDQRAALALTEDALRAAQDLQNEISGQAPTIDEVEPGLAEPTLEAIPN